jgi:hypothetical protein
MKAKIVGNPQLGYEANLKWSGGSKSFECRRAQDAFDWIAENAGGITVNVSIYGPLSAELAAESQKR